MIDDEDFRFGNNSTAHDEDIEKLEDDEYDHGYDTIKKEHVLEWMYEDEDMSVEEIGEHTGVRNWLVEKCLAYHRIDEDAHQGIVPKHPPWKPNPHPDTVRSVSGGQSLGFNRR